MSRTGSWHDTLRLFNPIERLRGAGVLDQNRMQSLGCRIWSKPGKGRQPADDSVNVSIFSLLRRLVAKATEREVSLLEKKKLSR